MKLISKYMKYLLYILAIFIPFSGAGQELEFKNFNGRLILGLKKDRTASISLGDIDGDQDIDTVVANGRHWPLQHLVFFNSGRGIFTVSQPLDVISETSYATELADFDRDGDLDVAVGNDMAPNTLYFNDGKGNFSRVGTFGQLYSPTRNLTVFDLDKDGDTDILITNRGAENE